MKRLPNLFSNNPLVLTQQSRADDTGVVAQFRLDDPGHFVVVAGQAVGCNLTAQGQQQLFVRLVADTTADCQRIRLKNVDDIAVMHFTEKDVVRHKLVQDIIKAYEKASEQKRERNTERK